MPDVRVVFVGVRGFLARLNSEQRDIQNSMPNSEKIILALVGLITMSACFAVPWLRMQQTPSVPSILPATDAVERITILDLSRSTRDASPAIISDSASISDFMAIFHEAEPVLPNHPKTTRRFEVSVYHHAGIQKVQVNVTSNQGTLITIDGLKRHRYRADRLGPILLESTSGKTRQ